MGRTYGSITIVDTTDIERIYMVYKGSESNTTAPTLDWSTINTWKENITQVSGTYIWQVTVIKQSGVPITSSNWQDFYGDPTCITGPQGLQGIQGKTGVGVSSITTTYCNYGSGTPAASYGGWQSTVPTYDSSKPNYWVKTVLNYDDGTSGDPIIYKDNGITSATSTAAAANTTANNANTTANNANTTANNALNLANGTSQHFWSLAEDTTTTGGTLAAGQYITDILQSNFKQNPGSSGNLLLRSDGVYLNLGLTTLASFKSNALTFYNSTGTELGTFGSTGLSMSGTLDIRGGGRIGQDSSNYWKFGDNRSYKDTDSAYLIGYGNASIQLGETGHWRLDRNRIHSGWYQLDDTTQGLLHFDTGTDGSSTYYWDYGINYPNKSGNGTNKFLYVRRSNATITSATLATMKSRVDDDTYWTYKFYVDGDGNVHAPGFYIGNSTTPIGGGAGTVAERLTQGYGSSTQPVYFNSNGVPTVTNLDSVYLSLAGGNVTGAVTFGSSVSVDELTVGDLIVNGSASFTNNLQANTINGVTVGSTPKFTDTVTTVTVTGTGNAITNASASNGAVTLTKGATFLTSYTETDPTVPAWAKASTKPSYALSEITGADDVKAIEALTGTSGFLKKTAANTWTLDTSTYITGITSSMVTTALGYTPYNSTNPNGYITANHTSTYSLPIAKYNVLGGVKPAYNSTGAVTLTTAAAANTSTPTIAAKSTTSGRYYAVEIDKNGVLFVNVPWTNVNSSYLTGITSNDVTTALGFTPYNSTNPNGYTTNTGTVTSVRVQASSPLQSSTSTASSTTLNTTISFINQDANKVLAGPSSGNAAAPTFRKLVAADIPNLSWNKITSDKPTTLSGYGITDAAGTNALVGLSASSNAQGVTTFTATRASGQNPLSFEVSITASSATGATKLRNSEGDISLGDEANPVYFSGGVPEQANTIPKLNNTTTGGVFYAPTSAGTKDYVLVANASGIPTWVPQSDISSGNTYTTTIATDSGTNQLTLAHGTKYKLTAGGTSFVFTMPSDTDEKLKVAAVTSGTTYYPIVGTGATAATRQYDTTGFVYVGTNGTANGSNGNALLTLGNSTASTTANWKKGTIRLYGTTAYYTDIVSGAPTANRTITLPNATGTVALTSQIPTVPTVTGNSTTGISIADHSTTSVGSASNWSAGSASTWVFEDKTVAIAAASATSIPNVTSAGSASSWTFEEKTIPNVTAVGSVPSLTVTSVACDDITAWSQGDLTFTMDTTDTMQLNINFTKPSLSYTARSVGSASNWSAGSTPTLGTAIKVQSKSGGGNGSAPTLGTPISITGVGSTTTVSSKKSGANSTVPSLTVTSTTVVNGKTHTITDNGHTHTIG